MFMDVTKRALIGKVWGKKNETLSRLRFSSNIHPSSKSDLKCQNNMLWWLIWGIVHLCRSNMTGDIMENWKIVLSKNVNVYTFFVKLLCHWSLHFFYKNNDSKDQKNQTYHHFKGYKHNGKPFFPKPIFQQFVKKAKSEWILLLITLKSLLEEQSLLSKQDGIFMKNN